MTDFKRDPRFAGINEMKNRIALASPTLHGEEKQWVNEAFETNWLSTGENVKEIERCIAEKIGRKHAVALSSGTAALHLAARLAADKLYGLPSVGHGSMENRHFFVSDLTFDATLKGALYECGTPIFIDSEPDSWNMDPRALEKAFERYPDVKLVIAVHLYGSPAKIEEIRKITKEHNALLIEDAAESFGATADGIQTGNFGDYGVISFNGNKIITGSSGGMLLCDEKEDADKIRKWSTQAREKAPWYQHEELGYNYRMSNLIAGTIRGQLSYLAEHISIKKAIWERYKEGFADLPVKMNPILPGSVPNYWLSCLLIDKEAMCETQRGDKEATYQSAPGKSCPTEILEAMQAFGIEGRPIWKPMHLQPLYRTCDLVMAVEGTEVSTDIFDRGLCLPSDIKMTKKEQDTVIKVVRACFGVR